MGRKLQDTFVYSRNFASRKPNSLHPSPSSFAALITTLYPVSYNSIITSTPEPPTESINAPAWPYYGKGYTKTDENWAAHPESY